WKASDNVFHNTNIRPVQASSASTLHFDLYENGIDSISDVKNLELRLSNGDSTNAIYVSKISISTTLSPTVNIYRWANVTVSDVQTLPVNGAIVSSVIESSGVNAYYNTPAG